MEFKLLESQSKFNSLAIKLRIHGYTVDTQDGQEYSIATISGQGIRGGFAIGHWNEWGHPDVSPHIWNRITFDKAEVFDKYSTCICSLPIAESFEDLEFALDQMDRLKNRKVNSKSKYPYLDWSK